MASRFAPLVAILANPVLLIGGAAVVGAGIVGAVWFSTKAPVEGAYVAASMGPLTEEVAVPGVVKAAQSTDLAFEIGGVIATIQAQVGSHVEKGQLLLALDGTSATAALDQAQAALEVQQANLASLTEGTRPEQLSIDETALAQAQAALADALRSAYVAADNAVHADADQVFSNPRTSYPTLTFIVPDAVLVLRIEAERVTLEPVLASWQAGLAAEDADPGDAVAGAEAALKAVSTFLDDLSTAFAEAQSSGSAISAAFVADAAAINGDRANVSAALSALTAADTAEKSAAGALALAQAGATQSAVAAQQAQVDAAQAAVASAQAALAKTTLRAPVSGTVTRQDADPGETVTPGVALVSLIADGAFEADAQVSQADIARVKVGEPVNATFDAYPGAAFPATVTTVDPSATTEGGVPSYGVTVTFSGNDPRVKAGLSANLGIVTATDASVLRIPQTAVITDGAQSFVYVRGAQGPVRTPVTLGASGVNGLVEVVSGLSPGDEVLSFGTASSS